MSWPHIHMLVTLIPVAGFWVALILLVIALGWDHAGFRKVALGVPVLLAVVTYFIPLTGGNAAGTLFESGVNMQDMQGYIKMHSHFARQMLPGVEFFGLLCLAGFFLKPPPKWYLALLILGCLGVNGLITETAALGGLIHHPEIRNEAFSGVVMQFASKEAMQRQSGDGGTPRKN